MSSYIFPKIAPFVTMLKNRMEPEMTSQCGTYTLHTGKARLQARTRIHTHTHTHTHTYTQTYVILIAFPRQQWFRERASLLRYTYIACLVQPNKEYF
jgi:hypothetical protein